MKEFVLDEKGFGNDHALTYKIKYYIDSNGCFICTSHKCSKKGYPRMRRHRKFWLISRYVWTINNGEIEDSPHILHSCDNPQCININHLSLGTNGDNVGDKMSKGRQARHSSLTDEDIIEIKRNIVNTAKELSGMFNVSSTLITRIWSEDQHKRIVIDGYDKIKLYRSERRYRQRQRKR